MSEMEFDLEAFDKAYEESLQEETPETPEETPEPETPELPETPEEPEQPEETPEVQPPAEDDKRNKAFADLRRQAEENKKFADFVQALADEAGMKPEDVLARYQDKKLQREAETQGVPVDVLKRINSLETENKSVKEQRAIEKLDSQVGTIMESYGIQQDDPTIQATFELMFQNGIDPLNNPDVDFNSFYRAANHEKIIQMEIEKARQNDLSAKKKRQQEAALPNGASVTQSGNSDLEDLAKNDAKNILANW